MIELTIEESDPEFFKALQNPQGFLPHLATAMENIVSEYQARAEVYAPESEANAPGRVNADGWPMGWYERGVGWWEPDNRSIKRKGIAVKDIAFQNIRYRLTEPSQQMGDRWVTEVQQTANEVIGFLSNTATYSGYVQGMEQIALHRSRGWQTVMDIWESGLQVEVDVQTTKALEAYYG